MNRPMPLDRDLLNDIELLEAIWIDSLPKPLDPPLLHASDVGESDSMDGFIASFL